jgi:hypothetical protein
MDNKMFMGSICLSDLIEQANRGHSAFVKGANGKVYCNSLFWLNETADKYGNVLSCQLYSLKDKRDTEGKIYFGNAKKYERQEPTQLGAANLSINDVNVRTLANEEPKHYHSTAVNTSSADIKSDDLPF